MCNGTSDDVPLYIGACRYLQSRQIVSTRFSRSSSPESSDGCAAPLLDSFSFAILGFDRFVARGMSGNFATGSFWAPVVKPS